jgi:hypothetical protein
VVSASTGRLSTSTRLTFTRSPHPLQPFYLAPPVLPSPHRKGSADDDDADTKKLRDGLSSAFLLPPFFFSRLTSFSPFSSILPFPPLLPPLPTSPSRFQAPSSPKPRTSAGTTSPDSSKPKNPSKKPSSSPSNSLTSSPANELLGVESCCTDLRGRERVIWRRRWRRRRRVRSLVCRVRIWLVSGWESRNGTSSLSLPHLPPPRLLPDHVPSLSPSPAEQTSKTTLRHGP